MSFYIQEGHAIAQSEENSRERSVRLDCHVTLTVYDWLLQCLSINKGQTHRSLILSSAFKSKCTRPPSALSM